MDNKTIIGALSQDLYRVAIGLHRGSTKMADRFIEEALKRKEEVDTHQVKPYILTLLTDLPKVFVKKDEERTAEDALMYSILFQNYAQTL